MPQGKNGFSLELLIDFKKSQYYLNKKIHQQMGKLWDKTEQSTKSEI